MLEELGLDYEVRRYQREASMQAPASLQAVHPLGKSPVITDGDRTLAESGAILEYLAETYGNGHFVPSAGTPERQRYTYFMHYAEGSLMPLLLMKLIFSRIPSQVPALVRPVARMISKGVDRIRLEPQLATHLAFLEGELAARDWFAGNEISAADFQMSFPLEAAAARAGFGASWRRLSAFLDRIHARPAYKRAIDRGGPYALLK
jgi:glutathione S-transferase